MISPMDRVLEVLKATLRGWREDYASFMAAGLTFYTIVSVMPILIIFLSLAGSIFEYDVEGKVVEGLATVVGPDAAVIVGKLVRDGGLDPARWTTQVVSLAIILYGASRIFSELQRAMRIIWRQFPGPSGKAVFLAALRSNLASFLMIFAAVLFWLAGIVVITAISLVGAWLRTALNAELHPLKYLPLFGSVGLLTLSFALVYRILSRGRAPWRHAWLGAVVTAVLMLVGQRAISIAFGYTSIQSVYGAAGSIMVLLFWFFYSWMIFLLGAEFTKACVVVSEARHRAAQDRPRGV
jgi:membrane protein